MRHPRLCRDPDLIVLWQEDGLLIRNVRTARSVCASPRAIALLSAFDRPRNLAALIGAYPPDGRETLSQAIREMERLGLLVRNSHEVPAGRLAAWNGNVASALYHAATRDLQYLVDGTEARDYMRERRTVAGRPPPFKRYPRAPAISLRATERRGTSADLSSVLEARRTTRDFSRRPVPLAALAAIVRGTWGQTGWLHGGELGRAPTRTSPSGGALHPIECYMVAIRVDGLEPGLYHYDVRGNDLRRLKAGDFRREAVRLASRQRWVGKAAFLCIMTAVFERTMWKYRRENAYRTVWLEAGHFAQTFSLLATSHGLGPFTTAAMQDSRIERFIGLDGVREFPVYLCGAGFPGPRRVDPRWTPIDDGAGTITASAPASTSPSKPRRRTP